MNRKFLTGLLSMFVAGSAFAQFGMPVDNGPASLKDAYDGYFTVGVAVNQRNVSDSTQIELIKKEFNSITAENDMKPGELHPAEGVWNWERGDKIADFCRKNGIKLRGHCLVCIRSSATGCLTTKMVNLSPKRCSILVSATISIRL